MDTRQRGLIYTVIVFALLVAGVLVYQIVVSRYFGNAPIMPSRKTAILVDNKVEDISRLNIDLPIDKEEAVVIAKKMCNKQLQESLNIQKEFPEEIYGLVGKLKDSWYIQIKAVNCICGTKIQIASGVTTCFYTVPTDEFPLIKF